MQCPQAPRPTHPLSLVAALTLGGLLLVGCEFETEAEADESATAPPFSDSVDGSWYVSDCEVTFHETLGIFEVSNFIGGYYQVTERGDYLFDGIPGMLSAFPLVDLMGSYGFSNNGDPFELDMLTRTEDTLVLETAGGETVVLSRYPPDLDTPPINEGFDGGELDPRWWTDGNVFLANGRLNIQGDNSAAGLWQLGFNRVEAEITLGAADGHSNVALGFSPFDENVVAKCGVAQSEDLQTTVFCQVYDLEAEETLYYGDLKYTMVGETHQVMMIWTGEKVEFYADGGSGQSYAPPFEGNLRYPGEPDVYSWGAGIQGTVDNFRAQY